jgi:hypothetical protein
MNEFRYVIDENGNKTAVIIDLEKQKEVWEEFSRLLRRKRRNIQQSLAEFSKLFDKQEKDEMSKAIEEQCEKIGHEW